MIHDKDNLTSYSELPEKPIQIQITKMVDDKGTWVNEQSFLYAVWLYEHTFKYARTLEKKLKELEK